jgi:FlaA1/EpsC-like NDP-sugar epimerase
MMEEHPQEAVLVNAVGTWRLAQLAADCHVERFVLISTDKAVRPSSVMGASKRVAELAVRAVIQETGLSACGVRFGNVLGSRGSVIPIFEKQIAAGGPITITDPRMRRYFMTIPEAAALTIQAATYTDLNAIFMLNMGEEVYIRELAERMVQLHGKTIGRDIQIEYVGLRDGEKLHEELALDTEIRRPTDHPDIFLLEEATDPVGDLGAFRRRLRELERLAHRGKISDLRDLLFTTVGETQQSAPTDVAVGSRETDSTEPAWKASEAINITEHLSAITSERAAEVEAPVSD